MRLALGLSNFMLSYSVLGWRGNNQNGRDSGLMFVRLVWCVLASEKNGPKKLTRQEILRDTAHNLV